MLDSGIRRLDQSKAVAERWPPTITTQLYQHIAIRTRSVVRFKQISIERDTRPQTNAVCCRKEFDKATIYYWDIKSNID